MIKMIKKLLVTAANEQIFDAQPANVNNLFCRLYISLKKVSAISHTF